MSGLTYALLFWSIVCVAVGATSLAVAARERGRASRAWILPGVAGVLLLAGCLIRLVMLLA